METRSRKKLKKSPDPNDRISQLSNDILIHILSFIPTVDSVATCLLSTRWKHLWKHVPILTFDNTLNCKTKSYNVRFAIFVDNVLRSHLPKVLEKLSLTCFENHVLCDIQSLDLTIYNRSIPVVRLPSSLFTCKTLEALVLKGKNHNIIVNVPTIVCLPNLKTMELVGLEYQDDQRDHSGKLVSACSSLESLVVEDETPVNDYVGFHTISSSTLKDVKFRLCQSPCLLGYNPKIFCSALRRLNLNISSCYSKTIRVPINVFTCSTLEQLVLNGRFVICATRTICLPNLTLLALLRVEFEDDQIFSRLMSSCTSLESLAVHKKIKAELNISSCTLKVIEVDLHCSSKRGHKLVISAPELKSLKLRSSGNVDYHIQELGSLEQANVDLGCFLSTNSGYCYTVPSNACQAFRYVKSLKIWQGYSDVGVSGHVSLPMFSKLIELDITMTCSKGYDLFQGLIMNSPKIENLVLTVEALHDHYWMDLNSVPACLLSSLRSVSIRSFRGGEDELAITLYILGNARIMEKMEICLSRYFRDSKSMKKKLCQKILKVPRGSAKCEVVFI